MVGETSEFFVKTNGAVQQFCASFANITTDHSETKALSLTELNIVKIWFWSLLKRGLLLMASLKGHRKVSINLF